MPVIPRFLIPFTLVCAAALPASCNKPEMAKPNSAAAVSTPPAGADSTNPAAEISAQEARNHIGETAVVTGRVFGVHVTQKGGVFLNLGAAYPNQPFTAVCFQQAIPPADLQKLEGRTIKVSGKIKDYNGQAEIVLEKPGQISQ